MSASLRGRCPCPGLFSYFACALDQSRAWVARRSVTYRACVGSPGSCVSIRLVRLDNEEKGAQRSSRLIYIISINPFRIFLPFNNLTFFLINYALTTEHTAPTRTT